MAAVRIALDLRPTNKIHPFDGFGAQLNTNIFRPTSIFPNPADAAKDHPKDREAEGQPRALTPAQHAELRATFGNLRPGHSRIFVGRRLVSVPKPPPKELDALFSTIRLAQDAKATVNLTFWGRGPYAGQAKLKSLPWPEPEVRNWPQGKEKQGEHKWPAALMKGGELTGPAELMRRFAHIIQAAHDAGLTCLKYATIQNEPNGDGTDLAMLKTPTLSMRLYERLYRLLDESLRELGVRDTVDLVAGDLVLAGQKEWLTYIHDNMELGRPGFDPVVDGYSIHVYWEPSGGGMGFPQRLQDRLDGLPAILETLGKPLYVTEFGVRKLGTKSKPMKPEPGGAGSGQTIEFSPDAAFQHAWFMALAPQYGCAGLVKWALYRTDRPSAWGEWGMIDAPNATPPRMSFGRSPTYRVTRLFNHLVERGWTADGFGQSPDGTVIASRFKGTADESVVVLNRNDGAQQVTVEVRPGTPYFAVDWNQDGDGAPATKRTQPVTSGGDGALTVTVPPNGVVGLSTRPLTSL